jgi:hypothetical protein
MAHVGWAEGIGYLASLLVFSTFYMKTMLPLRGVAIASNIAFMTYGLAGGIYPVLVLHVLLLPLNCLRLHQMQRLIRKGVFGPDHRRTGTAVCETDVEIGSISDKQAMQLYYQNPAFGFHLFRLVVQRVLENEQRWRATDRAVGS